MDNKQVRFLANRMLVAVFFIIWGVMWFVFSRDGALGNALKVIFVAAGVFHLFSAGRELLAYRKTGEVKTRVDERVEFNNLRASRRGFVFLVAAFSVMYAMRGFNMLNEVVFTAAAGPVIAAGVMVYLLSYHMFERKG